MFPFDPPENIRKPNIFWRFKGGQKGTLGRNGLNFVYVCTKWLENSIRRATCGRQNWFFIFFLVKHSYKK